MGTDAGAVVGAGFTRSRFALVAAALAGALLATYPLLLGRSLVSPANGPTALLYDGPPFAFGAPDSRPEPTRGTDVGAMMWAILPYTMVQREAFAHGEWPLWNRHNINGQPLWGQGQTFALDPVHLLSLTVEDPALAMDLRFVAGRVLFALGAGVAVLLMTGHVGAAALIALVSPFVAHFTARFNHPAYFSIVYAPWVLAAFAACGRARDRRAWARATVFLALATFLQIVGSTPKEGILALGAASLAGFGALMVGPRSRSDALGRLDAALLGAALGVLLAAPHWLVFIDTLSRAWTAYDAPQVQLAGWPNFVGYMLGAAAPGFPVTGGHPLLVVAAACALVRPRMLLATPLALGALAVMVMMFALAFGIIPPAVLLAIPMIRNVHHVWDGFLGATVPLLLVLAGLGVSGILTAAAPGVRLRYALTILGTGLALASMVPGDRTSVAAGVGFASVGGAILALGALALLRSGFGRRLLVSTGVVAAVLPGGLHLDTGVPALDALLLQPQARASLTRPSPAIEALQAQGDTEPARVMPVGAVLFGGTQAYWGLEGAGGPDAVRLPLSETLSDLSGIDRTAWIWRTDLRPDLVAGARPFLDMTNVRYLIARHDQVPPGTRALGQRDGDQVQALERPTAWPRAFFVGGVARHRGVEDFWRLLASSKQPFASVEVRETDAVDVVRDLPAEGIVVPATSYVLTPNTTAFHVRAPGPGLVVLTESFVAEDFRVTLNGQRVPYIRVNHAFKGVRIPEAGEWAIRFEYRPALWSWSWGLAGLGTIGLIALLLVPGGARRATDDPKG